MALDEEFNLCTVCKTAGKMLVNIVKEYYKQVCLIATHPLWQSVHL